MSKTKAIAVAEINRVALFIHDALSRRVKLEEFRPRERTALHRIWASTRLDRRQQMAWEQFVDDLRTADGKSGKVTSNYGEYTDKSTGYHRPVAYTNRQYDRIDALLTRWLSRSEALLLKDLVADEQNPGHFSLEIAGLVMFGFKDSPMARAASTAAICMLVNRIADFYDLAP